MATNIREKYAEHVAKSNAPKPLPVCSAAEAATAAKIFLRYRDANCIDRAYLREHHGNLVELGRRVVLFENNEPPEAA